MPDEDEIRISAGVNEGTSSVAASRDEDDTGVYLSVYNPNGMPLVFMDWGAVDALIDALGRMRPRHG